MSACAAVYFLNLKGDVLIERRYRDDTDREIAETFRTQILNARDTSIIQTPVRTLGSCTFMYLRHNDIYVLCITRNNANVMMCFKFMTSVVELCKYYLQGPVTELSVKNNFVLLYELLDEGMDYGYPQLTDPAVLKNFILQKSVPSGSDIFLDKKKAEVSPNATLTVTGAVGWRREGIRYKKNEVFLDIVEQVNLLMSSSGAVLRTDVAGKLMMKCFLSDMPELRLGLNEKVEDATFHQCVNLSTYDTQKVVTFIPPDGEFELMRYRCQEGITPPFKMLTNITEHGRTRVEINVNVKAVFSSKLFANSVVVLVPVPDNTASAKILVTIGKAKYDPAKKALVWKVSKYPGDQEHSIRAEVMLVATKSNKVWSRPPLSMSFQVPMLSASGLRVAYLKIMERKLGSTYKVDKWVRKVCKSGDYLFKA